MGIWAIIKKEDEITLEVHAGDTPTLPFTSPVEIDMALYPTVLFQVRERVAAKTLLYEKATGGSGIVVTAQDIAISHDGTETALKFGKFNWEMQVTDGSDIITIGKGDYMLYDENAFPQP